MSKPCLVFIPGIGSDCSMFDKVFAHLKSTCDRLDVELPGYAGTQLSQAYGFADLTELMASKIKERGPGCYIPFGHSIGGMAALEFGVTFPHLCDGLILSGTTPAFGGRDDSFKTQFLADRLKPLDDGLTMQELAKQSMPSLMIRDVPDNTLSDAIAVMARIPEAAYRAALACLVTFNRRDSLQEVSRPTLLLAGDKDMNAPLRTMQKMADAIPGSSIRIFENTGHMAPLECPQEVASAVLEFVEGIDK